MPARTLFWKRFLTSLLLTAGLPALTAQALPLLTGRASSSGGAVSRPSAGKAAIRASGSALRTQHAAGVGGSGSVTAWGLNSLGQSNVPAGLANVAALAAGLHHSLALKGDGTVVAWGNNAEGQLNVPSGLTGVTAIAAGVYHSLALKSDGTVVGWGNNADGQLNVPAGLTGVTAIATGVDHSLALKSDGTVVAWGANYLGQLNVPAGLTGVTAIAASYSHNLALKSDGTVVAWGYNPSGLLTVPAGLTGVTAIATGEFHSLALKSDGTVVAWGSNVSSQLNVPAGLAGVTAIATSYSHNLALKSDGTVVAWGNNIAGQSNVPAGLTGVTAIAAGEYHSLVLRATSVPRGWGYNQYGQTNTPSSLGSVTALSAKGDFTLALKSDGTVAAWGGNAYGVTNVPNDLTGVSAVAAGFNHALALKSNGTVVAWGANDSGQTDVPDDLTDVTAIAGGYYHSLALKSNGTVVSWGSGVSGSADVPDGLTDVIAIDAGVYFSLALKSDGTVVAWGDNGEAASILPAGLSDVIAIDAGSQHSVALKSDGTVVAWGRNYEHQTEVPNDLTGVTAIAAGFHHSLALKSNGTVVAWGGGDYSQAIVPDGLTGVVGLAAGSYHSLVLVANAAPTLTSPGAQQSLEDHSTTAAGFTVNDDLTSLNDLTLSAVSSVPTLVQSFTFGGSGANRTIQVNPAANQNGTATITLTVGDGVQSGSTTFQLTVDPVNDDPSFTKGIDPTVNEDAGPQSLPGWAMNVRPGPTNDEFTQNLTFQVTGNTNPGLFATAPAVNGTTGELTYRPADNAHGLATITLKLHDDGGTANEGVDTSAEQTFTITVNSVNDPPTTSGQSIVTDEDTAKAVTLDASDLDGDALTYVIVSGPAHGGLSGSDANRTYTPAANYHGPDSFTFKVNDGTTGGTADSNTSTVSITVNSINDSPTTSGQSVTTDEDTAKAVTLGAADVDGDGLTYTIVSGPAHGGLTGSGANRTYTPAANYHGPDSFTFKVNDGTGGGTAESNVSTVSITVNSVNDPPTTSGQSITTDEDTAKAVTLNAADLDGDALTYIIVSGPAHGGLTGSGANRTYTPAANYHGPDSFTFKVNDGTSGGTADSNVSTVSITVNSVNDAPVATGENYSTRRGTLVDVTAPGLLLNDLDVDGDALSVQPVSGPSGGTLTLNGNGSFRYTPNIGFTGTDYFGYRVSDGTVSSNTVQVAIVVSPDPPDSTPNSQVDATGTLTVAGGSGTLSLTARKAAGVVQGHLIYTEANRNRSVTSTQITAVVVTGRQARVFGKGKLQSGALVDFVVDLDDVAEPGRGRDTFRIQFSNGQSAAGVVSVGNVGVNR